MRNSSSSRSSGMSLCGTLFVVFLVLKLTGNIDWSWVWVLSPLWIGFAILIGFIALGFLGLGTALTVFAAFKYLNPFYWLNKRRITRRGF